MNIHQNCRILYKYTCYLAPKTISYMLHMVQTKHILKLHVKYCKGGRNRGFDPSLRIQFVKSYH